MAGRIELDIGLNASGVAKGAKDAEKALQNLEDAVKDVGKGGAKDIDTLERELKDVQKASEQASKGVDRLGREAKGAADELGGVGKGKKPIEEVGQAAEKTGGITRAMAMDVKQATQAVIEFGSGNTAGGMNKLLGATTSLMQMMPGIGLGIVLASTIASEGFDSLMAGLNEAEEKQRELEASASRWADAYLESADRIIGASHIVAEMQSIATDPEKYKQAVQNAEDWGVKVSDAMRAMAGDTTAMVIAQDGLNRKSKEWTLLNEEYNAAIERGEQFDQRKIDRMRELQSAVQDGTAALDGQTEAMRMGQEQADNAARALHDYAVRAGTATGKTDDLGNSIYALPDGKEVVIDAETQQAHEDLDAVEKKKLSDKSMTVRIGVDDSLVRNYKPPTIYVPGRIVAQGTVQVI